MLVNILSLLYVYRKFIKKRHEKSFKSLQQNHSKDILNDDDKNGKVVVPSQVNVFI